MMAQETVNHRYAAKVIPFNLLNYTPGSCDEGQVFVRKDQTYANNVYLCDAFSQWHLIGGGAGASSSSTSYLFGFPIAFQGTPPDGTALVFSAAQNSWIPTNVPVWKKYTVTYASAAVAALTNSIPLFTLHARQKICGISIYVLAAFTSPTSSATTVSVGDSLGTATSYTASTLSLNAIGAHDYNVFGSIYPGNGVVQATITATGALLSNMTAGSADILVCTTQQPQ